MNGQIEEIITKCHVCQENRNKQHSEPLVPHEIPSRPWSKVGADLFYLDGQEYLLIVDYYSKFPEVVRLADQTAHSVIQAMKSVFARSGIPDLVFSDNAQQFTGYEFQAFKAKWEFEHRTSSPGFPQSNGQAERAVQTVKNIMKKAKKAGEDIHLSLLEYRNTPLDGTGGYSPAQLLIYK